MTMYHPPQPKHAPPRPEPAPYPQERINYDPNLAAGEFIFYAKGAVELFRLSPKGAWIKGESVETTGDAWRGFTEWLAHVQAEDAAHQNEINARALELEALRAWRIEAVKVLELAVHDLAWAYHDDEIEVMRVRELLASAPEVK